MIRLLKKIEEHRERTSQKRNFEKAKKKTKFAATLFFTPLTANKIK